jgi:hypothetical protein
MISGSTASKLIWVSFGWICATMAVQVCTTFLLLGLELVTNSRIEIGTNASMFLNSAMRTVPQSFLVAMFFVGLPTLVIILVTMLEHITDFKVFRKRFLVTLILAAMLAVFFVVITPVIFVPTGLVVGSLLGYLFHKIFWALAGSHIVLHSKPMA